MASFWLAGTCLCCSSGRTSCRGSESHTDSSSRAFLKSVFIKPVLGHTQTATVFVPSLAGSWVGGKMWTVWGVPEERLEKHCLKLLPLLFKADLSPWV